MEIHNELITFKVPIIRFTMSYVTSPLASDYLTIYTTSEASQQFSEGSAHDKWFESCNTEFDRMKQKNPKRQLVDDLRLSGDGEYKEENTHIRGPVNARNVSNAYKNRIQAMNNVDMDPEEELERITDEIIKQTKVLKTLQLRRQQLMSKIEADK
jgi:hypothetical protein